LAEETEVLGENLPQRHFLTKHPIVRKFGIHVARVLCYLLTF
jgi:hypothetical protein